MTMTQLQKKMAELLDTLEAIDQTALAEENRGRVSSCKSAIRPLVGGRVGSQAREVVVTVATECKEKLAGEAAYPKLSDQLGDLIEAIRDLDDDEPERASAALCELARLAEAPRPKKERDVAAHVEAIATAADDCTRDEEPLAASLVVYAHAELAAAR